MKARLLIILCTAVAFTIQDERTKNFPRQTVWVDKVPPKQDVWVFIMAGQSNMAGRGLVEPQDTLVDPRILTINAEGRLVYAKEPFHFYEPRRTGLDCGGSFAKTLIKELPANISVLMIPVAVGGSSVSQWLGDSTYRGVKLMTNFREKLAIAQQYGIIKGILWHQGESDANKMAIPLYQHRLQALFTAFRNSVPHSQLPVLIGELGSYSNDPANWQAINQVIHAYSATDPNSAVIATGDLQHAGDTIHFNSAGQRLLGMRFARTYLQKFNGRVSP